MFAMKVQTKFLRLFKPVALGDHIDGWRVCWIGGWDRFGFCSGCWSKGKGARLMVGGSANA